MLRVLVPGVATGLIAALAFGVVACNRVPTKGADSIYASAEQGDMDSLRGALRQGYQVNTPDEKGMTLLHHAAAGNQPDVIEMLLNDYAANANAKDSQDRTPLDVARENGSQEVVLILEQESG